jgi:hypothetical protein
MRKFHFHQSRIKRTGRVRAFRTSPSDLRSFRLFSLMEGVRGLVDEPLRQAVMGIYHETGEPPTGLWFVHRAVANFIGRDGAGSRILYEAIVATCTKGKAAKEWQRRLVLEAARNFHRMNAR